MICLRILTSSDYHGIVDEHGLTSEVGEMPLRRTPVSVIIGSNIQVLNVEPYRLKQKLYNLENQGSDGGTNNENEEHQDH